MPSSAEALAELWDTLLDIVGDEAVARRILKALGGAHLPSWPSVERALKYRAFLRLGSGLTAGQISQRCRVDRTTARRWKRSSPHGKAARMPRGRALGRVLAGRAGKKKSGASVNTRPMEAA